MFVVVCSMQQQAVGRYVLQGGATGSNPALRCDIGIEIEDTQGAETLWSFLRFFILRFSFSFWRSLV